MREAFRLTAHIDADAWIGNVGTLGARVVN
jgi:hypothetical protein